MRTEQVSNNFRAFHAKETTEITINSWDSKQGTKEGMILNNFSFFLFYVIWQFENANKKRTDHQGTALN